MTLEEKITLVEQFYTQLDEDLAAFQHQTKLACMGGCSSCCQSPRIEVTILELLPFAFHLYKENKAEAFYDKLLENPSPTCALYNPIASVVEKGSCTNYSYRALICRLFGFSYTHDKLGTPKLITCSTIKETQPEIYQQNEIGNTAHLPMASAYQNQLNAIDPHLSQQFYPINKALLLAIEVVITHFRYTDVIGVNRTKTS